jgi:hypothetical protein
LNFKLIFTTYTEITYFLLINLGIQSKRIESILLKNVTNDFRWA